MRNVVALLLLLAACAGPSAPSVEYQPQPTAGEGVRDAGVADHDAGSPVHVIDIPQLKKDAGSTDDASVPTAGMGGSAGAAPVDVDAGPEPVTRPITKDTRIAVAYCASLVLADSLPTLCSSEEPTSERTHLYTVCDNTFEIQWNCPRCGDGIIGDATVGHVNMREDGTTFEVSFTVDEARRRGFDVVDLPDGGAVSHAPAYMCQLNSTGDGFTAPVKL